MFPHVFWAVVRTDIADLKCHSIPNLLLLEEVVFEP